MKRKSILVVGTDIYKHGDAHTTDGFCSTIRKAKVSGEIKNNKIISTSFELLLN